MIEPLERKPAYRRLLDWQWSHNSLATDLIRMFIGGALLARGLAFAADADLLVAFAGERAVSAAKYYIIISHIGGGAFLFLGLFTRLAALVQLPVLIIAVFFVNLPEGLGAPSQSLETSGLVLVILSTLLVFGAGRFSLDYRIFGRRLEARATTETA